MMEELMKVLTINELMRLTRAELCSLATRIAAKLLTYREGSSSKPAPVARNESGAVEIMHHVLLARPMAWIW
jgi:hypothetical protein